MKIAVLASLLATAAAFAPAQQRVAHSTALASTSEDYWDPLGLYTLGNGEAFDTFPNMFPNEQFLSEAERKHGRMAMLGWTGIWATTEGGLGLGLHFPGFPVEPDWTKALGVFAAEEPAWFGGILAFIMIAEGEGVGHTGDNFRGKSTKTPGDMGFDYLGLKKKLSAEKQAHYLESELKNGRAAMIAMASLFSFKAVEGSVPLMELIGAN
ncbi:Fucoxanthin-chlorophyll a-c binding protein [Seminavis robusta]|uniref:Fucoxanthin-chlorophyll a-c binding protein n=1 Tax=Seminavis robusta TaxID=568900 RepID=A0A9N8EGI7_9STRA|nr:Fucoxanthin-chlorophyll a-c binding protein [Seminavis robusta]|eukprot:Sro1157_g247350.1 Fucoxanthin-chlorophyll a-c binding protein (210) ;mRNA; r:9600-10305